MSNLENKNSQVPEESDAIDTLSSILNDENTSLSTPQRPAQNIININIQELKDVVNILSAQKYDFVHIVPQETYVKLLFKKDSQTKEEICIHFNAYQSIVLETKKVCGLKTDVISEEQKGTGKYLLESQNIEIISKFLPSNMGEEIFLKIKEEKISEKKSQTKKGVDIKAAFTFFSVLLVVALIVGGGFLGFIVFNAQTVQDVSFFNNLGINLNQINAFLLNVSRIIFSILVFIQTILLIIFLFKAFLTKKEFKRKKTIATLLSIFLFVITFATGSFWLIVDKKIRELPNWLEMSYGRAQVFDNALLVQPEFGKEGALISNFTNLIGPIELKFDLNYYNSEQLRQGFRITEYVWSFNNREETHNAPELIKNFDTPGVTNIALKVIGQDRTGKILEKIVTDVPSSISLANNVKIEERVLSNGGKMFTFDATSLSNLGTMEWYFVEDISKPAYVGTKFIPSKVYFEDSMIGLIIRTPNKTNNRMDKIFTIRANTNEITANIKSEASFDDDLTYTFQVENISGSDGDGFIERFVWNIEGQEFLKTANIENPDEQESSSAITHTFKNYGPQTIRVRLTNTRGQTKDIIQEVNIPKRLTINNQLIFSSNNQTIEAQFEEKMGDYFISDFGIPGTLEIDAKQIRADNLLYMLEEVKWDIGGNGAFEQTGKEFKHEFITPGEHTIEVHYTFRHRRNAEDVIEMIQRVYVESGNKEAILDLKIKPESDYVPTTVIFDASESTVFDDDIVKFIYDYGNGIVEERDAINLGHRYIKEGIYDITLTVVTRKGKEYSITEKLVLKPQGVSVKVSSSLSRAPVEQEISFYSAGSEGQISRYLWDFGDGFSSTEANPSYSYKAPGRYKVTLTLDYINNNTLSESMEIEIYERD